MAEELYFVRAPIGRLPLDISYLSSGQIMIHLKRENIQLLDFSAGIDNRAYFDNDEFTVESNDSIEIFSYNTPIEYKTHPLLLKWLQAQNLPKPNPLEKND